MFSNKISHGLNFLVVLILVVPIFTSIYKFYLTKNYNFLIEAECDSTTTTCFTRDCSNPDDCPPNGFSEYREYYIKAYNFAQCKNNSCLIECLHGEVECIENICGSSANDTCTTP